MAPVIELPEIHGQSLYTERVAPHRFKLTKDVPVQLSTGQSLFIPAGYITDFASVPRIFWAVVMPVGRHNLAVLVHDYLIDQEYPRRFCDQQLKHFLYISNVHPVKARAMYAMCRMYASIKPVLTRLNNLYHAMH